MFQILHQIQLRLIRTSPLGTEVALWPSLLSWPEPAFSPLHSGHGYRPKWPPPPHIFPHFGLCSLWVFGMQIYALVGTFQGLLAAIPLAYILPGLAYIQMEPHALLSREKLPALGLVVFGALVTILGAAVLLPGLMGGDCRADIVMGYCRQEFQNATASN